jgi:ubiquinone/menaquinone biosynthesis C-methylase UbiE
MQYILLKALTIQHSHPSPTANHRSGGLALRVMRAEAEALPFPDESFDAVVSTLVFCTLRDPPAALKEVHRVLRPGGRWIFVEHVRVCVQAEALHEVAVLVN